MCTFCAFQPPHFFHSKIKTRLEIPSSSQVPESANKRDRIGDLKPSCESYIRQSGGEPSLYLLVVFFLEPPALLRPPKIVPAAAAPTEGPVAPTTAPTEGIVPSEGPVHAPKEPPRPIVLVAAAPTAGSSPK